MSDADRTDKLLALILLHNMKGANQRDKALQLNLAGFSNLEIADLLQTNSAGVATLLYQARKGKKKKL
jgi:DNA-directed RNA polymerase specialized sigma24 family protein